MTSNFFVRALLAVAALAGTANTAPAQGTAEQREACTPDALRLCADAIPDVDKPTACMKAHRAALSRRCQAAFDTPSAPPREKAREKTSESRPMRRARPRAEAAVVPRVFADPDAEIPYRAPRRVIAPPFYSEPGPPLSNYGDAYHDPLGPLGWED